MPRSSIKRVPAAAFLCVLVLILCEAVVYPVAEVGIADDWSYVETARTLASTGHIAYNGWSTAMLGWQLWWGAFFARLFGPSFFVLRSSVFVLALATTALLCLLFRRCGLRPANAALGTLTVILSPLFLLLAFNFMSDIPGLFSLVVCMYGCLRATESNDRDAVQWLTAAIISNVVLGSARQICWLGLIVLVPTTLWLLRSRRRVILVGSIEWTLGLIAIWLQFRWFLRQPYSVPEKLFMGFHRNQLEHLMLSGVLFFLGLPLYMLPLWLPLLVQVKWQQRRQRLIALVLGTATTIVVAVLTSSSLLPIVLQPTLGPEFSPWGIWDTPFGPVHRPLLLHVGLREGLSAATLLGFCDMLLVISSKFNSSSALPRQSKEVRSLALLFGPLTLSYLLLLVSRSMYSTLYDRYLLLIVVVFALFTLLLVQRLPHERLYTALAWPLLGVAALFTIMMTHDSYTRYRARLVAIDKVLSAGVPRTSVRGELEFDGTTEIQTTGHVNEGRIVNPHGAYRVVPHPATWMDVLYPHVNPVYVFVFDDASYGMPTQFAPVTFTQWLGDHRHTFYTRLSPPQMLHATP